MASPELPSAAFAHGPESGEAGRGLGGGEGPESAYNYLQQPAQPKFKGIDFGDRETWNRKVSFVSELEAYDVRDYATRILGLPVDTPWDEIHEYLDEQTLIYLARDYGLPEDTSRGVIFDYLEKEEDEKWLARARALGLPDDATGKDVDEVERKQQAWELGLSEDTSWGEIWRTQEQQKREKVFEMLHLDPEDWTWEELLRQALCLSGKPTADEFLERIQEIREWHVERIVNKELEVKKELAQDSQFS